MKRYLMFLMVFVAFLVLSACGTEQNDMEKANQDEPIEENGDEAGEGEETEEQTAEKMTETGIYVGQADPHTIEIETRDGENMAFQLSMEAREEVEQLTDGVEVTYTYYKEGEQLIIETIRETPKSGDAGEDNQDKLTETGIYNGQADPHTIEVETEDGPTAFQLTMEARDDIDALTEGHQVTYTYYKEGEQLVIEKIQHSEQVKITESGTYVGQADPHTIEIETEEGPAAFQLTMEAREDVEALTDGHEVTYTYYKDGEQLVIETIKEK